MRLIISLIALVLAVLFAVQNTAIVDVAFFIWRLRASLAVVIVVCFGVGALIGLLTLAPGLYRGRTSTRRLELRVAQLEADNAELKTRAHKPLEAGGDY